MVEKRIEPYLFPSDVRKLAALPPEEGKERLAALRTALSNPAIRRLMLKSRYSRLVDQVFRRLYSAALTTYLSKDSKGVHYLYEVADFLALLAHSEISDLAWVVRERLQRLGIKRLPKKRGRPAGRRIEAIYASYLEVALDLIEKESVWKTKKEMKKKYPRDWQRKLETELRRRGWPQEVIDRVWSSRSSHSFAIWLVAIILNHSYDAIARACRRAKAARK